MTSPTSLQQSPASAQPAAAAPAKPGALLAAATAVCLVLFGAYLLSFSGRLHSIDEHSMLAVTESLAKGAGVRTDQNLWHVDFAFPSDTFGLDGHFYSKKGPATSLVALPFYWLAVQTGNVAPGHAALLSTLVVSAVTGAALVLLVARLGYGVPAGVLVALAWGLTTMAWPYARYFFSEPVAALFLLLGWLWLTPDHRGATPHPPGLLAIALSGLALGAAATTRLPYLAALPVFGLYLLSSLSPRERIGVAASAGQPHSRSPGETAGVRGDGRVGESPREALSRLVQAIPWPRVLLWCTAVALSLLGYGLYNLVRFGNPLSAGFVPEERFSLPFWEGALGMLVSPGRSVFLFSPIALLGVVLWWRFLRQRPAAALLIVALCLGHLLVYGGWYMWWGGLAWGPRFLVPILPFALVPLAALPRGPLWRAAVAVLLLGGMLVNGSAVLASFTDATEASASFSPANWSLRQSSLVQQFRLVRPAAFDLAWWHGGNVDWVALALGGAVLAAGAGWLAWALHQARRPAVAGRPLPGPPSDETGRGRVATAALAGVAVVLALGAGWGSVARYFDPASGSENLRSALASMHGFPSDTTLILGTPQRADWLALYAPLPRPAIVVAKNSVERDARVARTLQLAAAEQPRTVFAIEYTAPGDRTSLAEAELDASAFKAATRWFADEIRLVTYLRPTAASAPARPGNLALGENLRLERYGIEVIGHGRVDGEAIRARPGDRIGVRLEWRAVGEGETPVGLSYTRFAHVERTAAGVVLAQNDRPPVDGIRPTNTWRPNEPVLDLFVIEVPADARPGDPFDLVIGLYDPQSGARLPVKPAEPGAPAVRHSADAAILGSVVVEG